MSSVPVVCVYYSGGVPLFVGVEWEGTEPESEVEGVRLTKRLLERVREDLV